MDINLQLLDPIHPSSHSATRDKIFKHLGTLLLKWIDSQGLSPSDIAENFSSLHANTRLAMKGESCGDMKGEGWGERSVLFRVAPALALRTIELGATRNHWLTLAPPSTSRRANGHFKRDLNNWSLTTLKHVPWIMVDQAGHSADAYYQAARELALRLELDGYRRNAARTQERLERARERLDRARAALLEDWEVTE